MVQLEWHLEDLQLLLQAQEDQVVDFLVLAYEWYSLWCPPLLGQKYLQICYGSVTTSRQLNHNIQYILIAICARSCPASAIVRGSPILMFGTCRRADLRRAMELSIEYTAKQSLMLNGERRD